MALKDSHQIPPIRHCEEQFRTKNFQRCYENHLQKQFSCSSSEQSFWKTLIFLRPVVLTIVPCDMQTIVFAFRDSRRNRNPGLELAFRLRGNHDTSISSSETTLGQMLLEAGNLVIRMIWFVTF